MADYTVNLEKLEYELNLNSNKVQLSLSRVGGQGSGGVKGDSITEVSLNASNELVVTISNSVGTVVETINLGGLVVTFPNITTTQKNAMSNVAGYMVFDTTLGKMCFNTGSAWETITSS